MSRGKRHSHKRGIVIFCILAFAGMLCTDIYYRFLYPFMAYRTLFDRIEHGEELSQAEVRQIAHKILTCPGSHHDAYIYLIGAGDETSIPYLINSLKWPPRTDSDGGMI